MKKKIVISLGVLSSFVALCSCQSKKTEIVSLNIWTYYNGTTQEAFMNMIETFNKGIGTEKGIVVSTKSQGTNVNDLVDALMKSAKNEPGAQDMPELFISYSDCAYELDKLGKVVSLDSYFTSSELANFNEGFINEGRFGENNELKILPVSKSTEALFINKTDFDKFLYENKDVQVGYNDLTTIEGLIRVSEAYYNKTGKAFFGRDSLDNYMVVGAKQLGINIFSYTGTNYGINYNREVFKKLWDSYYVPYVKGYFSSVGKFRSNDIQAGTILSYIGSTSSGGYFPKKVETEAGSYAIESKIMMSPVFENGNKVAVSQGAGFCVSKSTRAKEEASITFLKWLTEKENITTFATTSGYFPATKDGFSKEFIESQSSTLYKDTFEICQKTTQEYTMYTNLVGPNSNTYRNTLKTSLDEACKKARAAVLAAGETKEIIAEYTSEERFNEWFLSLQS